MGFPTILDLPITVVCLPVSSIFRDLTLSRPSGVHGINKSSIFDAIDNLPTLTNPSASLSGLIESKIFCSFISWVRKLN